MTVSKDQIKNVIAGIMFIDDAQSIADETKIFSELALSSIDFIDLVFELRKTTATHVSAETLWPFPDMMLNEQYYQNGVWTEKGLERIKNYTGTEFANNATLKDLYPHFTVDYLHHVLTSVTQ